MFNRWMARMAARRAKVVAAERFVAVWDSSGLAASLTEDYDCTLTCPEADAMVGLFRAFGEPETADYIAQQHARHDEDGDAHYVG